MGIRRISSSQLLLTSHIWLTDHQQTSMNASIKAQALVCTIQVCVRLVPRSKDISACLTEAIVAAHLSGKGYIVISEQFKVHHSVRKTIHKWARSDPGVVIPGNSPQSEGVLCFCVCNGLKQSYDMYQL